MGFNSIEIHDHYEFYSLTLLIWNSSTTSVYLETAICDEVHESLSDNYCKKITLHPRPVNLFRITVNCFTSSRTICHQISVFLAPVFPTLELTRLRIEDGWEIWAGDGQDLCSSITMLLPCGGVYLQAGVVAIKMRQVPTTSFCSSTMAEQWVELVPSRQFWKQKRVIHKTKEWE